MGRKFVSRIAALMLAGAPVAGCERHAAERVTTTAANPTSEPVPSAVAQTQPEPKGCVVPMGDPPRRAQPAATCPKAPDEPAAMPRAWVSFPDTPGQPRVAVEVANTNTSRERGLMYRKTLPEDQGMIFTWEDEAERSFWMHDTCLPLDMIYVSRSGVIAGVLEQVPPMDETPRAVPCPILHVLEVNAGWTRAHGVAPGQRIVVER